MAKEKKWDFAARNEEIEGDKELEREEHFFYFFFFPPPSAIINHFRRSEGDEGAGGSEKKVQSHQHQPSIGASN